MGSVRNESLVGKGSKVAKRLEIDPSAWKWGVVSAEFVERIVPVVHVAEELDDVEVVLALAQMLGSEVVSERSVHETRKWAPVEGALACDVARWKLAVAAEWRETEVGSVAAVVGVGL